MKYYKKERCLILLLILSTILLCTLLTFPTVARAGIKPTSEITDQLDIHFVKVYYINNSNQITQFYDSTDPNNELHKTARENLRSWHSIKLEMSFDIKANDDNSPFIKGDWFFIPLDSSFVDFPITGLQTKIIDSTNTTIAHFQINELDGKKGVYFELDEGGNGMRSFTNGTFTALGVVSATASGNEVVTIGSEVFTLEFKVTEEEDNPDPPSNPGSTVVYKPGVIPDSNLSKTVSSYNPSFLRYRIDINERSVAKYYASEENWQKDNLILIDNLGPGLKFEKDKINCTLNPLLPYPGFKLNDNKEVIKDEDGNPIVTGLASYSLLYPSLLNKNEIEWLDPVSGETNAAFYNRIKNKPLSYGISPDGKSFYLNLGSLPANNSSEKSFKIIGDSDDDIKNYINNSNIDESLKEMLIKEFIKYYGESSDSPFTPIMFRVSINATPISASPYSYINECKLNFNETEVIQDEVFSRNYQSDATLEAGAFNSISIIKVDADDPSIKLKDVEFSLYKKDDSSATQTKKTNSSGILKFENLSPGKYKVVENLPANGYEISSYEAKVNPPYTFDKEGYLQIKDDNPNRPGVIIQATNEQKSEYSIQISKKDADTLSALDNAVFELYYQEKTNAPWKLIDNAFFLKQGQDGSNKKGVFETTETLLAGNYFISETTAPEMYDKNSLTVSYDTNNEGAPSNEVINGYTITVNGSKIKGSYFTIDPSNANTINDMQVKLNATNTMIYHDIKLTKYGISGNTAVAIKNVTFQLLNKLDDNSWNVYDRCISDENGEIHFEKVRPGTYKIKELFAPTGWDMLSFKLYNQNDVTVFSKQIVVNSNATPINQINIDNKLSPTTFNYIATNTPASTRFSIHKTEENNPDIPIEGARFALQAYINASTYGNSGWYTISGLTPNSSGLFRVHKENGLNEITTNKAFILTTTATGIGELSTTYGFIGGKYRLVEVDGIEPFATNRYDPLSFNLSEITCKTKNGTTQTLTNFMQVSLNNGEYIGYEFELPALNKNEMYKEVHFIASNAIQPQSAPIASSLRLIKSELFKPDILLANSQFKLEKENANSFLWTTVSEGITDEYGEIFFSNLEIGNYRLTELIPPTGYSEKIADYKLIATNEPLIQLPLDTQGRIVFKIEEGMNREIILEVYNNKLKSSPTQKPISPIDPDNPIVNPINPELKLPAPQTSDTSRPLVWIGLLIVSCSSLWAIIYTEKHR